MSNEYYYFVGLIDQYPSDSLVREWVHESEFSSRDLCKEYIVAMNRKFGNGKIKLKDISDMGIKDDYDKWIINKKTIFNQLPGWLYNDE